MVVVVVVAVTVVVVVIMAVALVMVVLVVAVVVAIAVPVIILDQYFPRRCLRKLADARSWEAEALLAADAAVQALKEKPTPPPFPFLPSLPLSLASPDE